MECKVLKTIEKYEERVNEGKIRTFSIRVGDKNLIIQPDGENINNALLLDQELWHTLQIFFYDVEAIPYLSYDYTTLKSLLNAHACLARMNQS